MNYTYDTATPKSRTAHALAFWHEERGRRISAYTPTLLIVWVDRGIERVVDSSNLLLSNVSQKRLYISSASRKVSTKQKKEKKKATGACIGVEMGKKFAVDSVTKRLRAFIGPTWTCRHLIHIRGSERVKHILEMYETAPDDVSNVELTEGAKLGDVVVGGVLDVRHELLYFCEDVSGLRIIECGTVLLREHREEKGER